MKYRIIHNYKECGKLHLGSVSSASVGCIISLEPIEEEKECTTCEGKGSLPMEPDGRVDCECRVPQLSQEPKGEILGRILAKEE